MAGGLPTPVDRNGFVPLCPNEELRTKQSDLKYRRIIRMQQVRAQERLRAAATREKYQRTKKQHERAVFDSAKENWTASRQNDLKTATAQYNASLEAIGEAHARAREADEQKAVDVRIRREKELEWEGNQQERFRCAMKGELQLRHERERGSREAQHLLTVRRGVSQKQRARAQRNSEANAAATARAEEERLHLQELGRRRPRQYQLQQQQEHQVSVQSGRLDGFGFLHTSVTARPGGRVKFTRPAALGGGGGGGVVGGGVAPADIQVGGGWRGGGGSIWWCWDWVWG